MSSPTLELKPQLAHAGAGAGKTTRLVEHVIEVALFYKSKHGRFPKLVVTTFTRKATHELRERLLKKGYELGDPELLQFLLSKKDLHISTIHGVLGLLLTQHGFRIGIDPGFKFVDSSEANFQTKKLLRDVLLQMPPNDLVERFGFSTLVDRLQDWMQAYRLDPSILPLSFNDLKLESRSFYKNVVGDARSLANDIFEQTTQQSWLDFAETLKSITKYINLDLRKPPLRKNNPAVDDQLDERSDILIEKIKSLSDPIHSEVVQKELSQVYQDLQKLGEIFLVRRIEDKKKSGLLEISDIELFSLDLIKNYPDVSEQFSSRWDYWLIDEFQDTSPLQVVLLKALIKNNPYFVVGDPQQSIYFFRGARAEVFSAEEKLIKQQNGVVSHLNVNYRSRPELLDFMNDLLGSYSSGFDRMKSAVPATEKPEVAVFGMSGSGQEELEFIVTELKTLIENGARAERIGILCRHNKTLKEISTFLESRGFSTQVHAAGGFFERREILDALALLKVFVNPHDDQNLLEILRSPWFCVPDYELIQICNDKQKKSIWHYIFLQPAQPEAFLALQKHILKSRDMGILHAFEDAIVQSGLLDFSHFHDASGQRESNIWKLLTQLREATLHPTFNYLNFIKTVRDSLNLEESNGDGDATAAFEPNRINLMTVHLSKGLQFDHVFIPRIGEKLRPSNVQNFVVLNDAHRWACMAPIGESAESVATLSARELQGWNRQQELKEFDRLFYVAVTRARQKVYLSCGEKRQEQSWLARLKWNLESGVVEKNNYIYRVETGPWGSPSILESAIDASVIEPLELRNKKSVGLRHATVSEVLNSHFDYTEKKSSLQSDPHKMIERSVRGVLIHRFFEAVHYNGLEKVDALLSSYFPGEEDDLRGTLSYLLNTKEAPLRSLIQNGHVEWGFVCRSDSLILEGQIDLWGVHEKKTWLVDYKSGRSTQSERAFQQLELYAWALENFGYKAPFQLAVVYPLENKTLVRELATTNSAQKKLMAFSAFKLDLVETMGTLS